MKETTIEKVPFKINLQVLASIIGGVVILGMAFIRLQTQITLANVGIAAILEKIDKGEEQHGTFTSQLSDHESRVSKIEGMMGVRK